jgi:hypothetical protein
MMRTVEFSGSGLSFSFLHNQSPPTKQKKQNKKYKNKDKKKKFVENSAIRRTTGIIYIRALVCVTCAQVFDNSSPSSPTG